MVKKDKRFTEIAIRFKNKMNAIDELDKPSINLRVLYCCFHLNNKFNNFKLSLIVVSILSIEVLFSGTKS